MILRRSALKFAIFLGCAYASQTSVTQALSIPTNGPSSCAAINNSGPFTASVTAGTAATIFSGKTLRKVHALRITGTLINPDPSYNAGVEFILKAPSLADQTVLARTIALSSTETFNEIIPIPSAANWTLEIEEIGGLTDVNSNLTINCLKGGTSDKQAILNQIEQISRQGQQQTNNLLKQRVRQVSQGVRAGRAQRQSPQAPQIQGQNGQNAGDEDIAYGIWGNLAVTRYEDQHNSNKLVGIQGTALAGADIALSDSLIVGGALNLETAYIEQDNNETEISSTGIGISPYLSWSIDDTFSVSALGNMTYLSAHTGERNPSDSNQIIETDLDSLRWNITTQADGFWSWGNWGLLSGIGLSYGQNHQFSTKDSQGTIVDSNVSRIGTASVSILPSYYWQYSDNLAFEPYLLGEYNYDYSFTKVSTTDSQTDHPNDRDQFRLGAGINLFSGEAVSGNLEASTVIGRQDYLETTLSGNLRVNF